MNVSLTKEEIEIIETASEKGWWGDALYRSKLPANVYTPAQYPDGWEAVE